MNVLALPALVAVCFLSLSTAASAGASPPAGFTPDPKLKTETVAQLRQRVARACLTTQARIQGVTQAAVPARGCNCYAQRTLASFTPAELQEYRDTGLFNATAREKGLAALDACGLKRPS